MGLFDWFTGDAQRQDLAAADAAATAALKKGLKQFTGTREDYLNRSLGEYDAVQPTIQTGQQANNLYRIALGLEGPQAQADYYARFNADPGYQALVDETIRQTEGSAANRGGLLSGGTIRGITDRVGLLQNNLFQDRLNRLAQLGQFGAQAGLTTAGQRANLQYGTGADIGAAQFGTGQLRANQAIGFGNQMAASRSIPINNLLGVANAGARIAGLFL